MRELHIRRILKREIINEDLKYTKTSTCIYEPGSKIGLLKRAVEHLDYERNDSLIHYYLITQDVLEKFKPFRWSLLHYFTLFIY